MAMKFFQIMFVPMISFGSFRVKDVRHLQPDTYWYEITFLFIEITWGRVPQEKK